MTFDDRSLLAQIDAAEKRIEHGKILADEVECLRAMLRMGVLDVERARAMVSDLWVAIAAHRQLRAAP